MSMKFVPFTTRPLSTSRQGITRLSSMACALAEDVLRLLHGEAVLVQRLAGDHAGQVHEAQALQRPEVVERRDPARVEEAPADDLRDPPDLLEIRALEHPVAVHV